MNKTEAAYADHLRMLQAAGEVLDFGYQRVKLRLAGNTFYTPDFDVQIKNGELELHEVKGFWDDDARVKIKVAAALFGFRFVGVERLAKNRWRFEHFAAAPAQGDTSARAFGDSHVLTDEELRLGARPPSADFCG